MFTTRNLPTNYYTTLHLPTTATDEDIRKSYKDLAKILHPDKRPNNPKATSEFQHVRSHLPCSPSSAPQPTTNPTTAPRSLLNPIRHRETLPIRRLLPIIIIHLLPTPPHHRKNPHLPPLIHHIRPRIPIRQVPRPAPLPHTLPTTKETHPFPSRNLPRQTPRKRTPSPTLPRHRSVGEMCKGVC